MDDKTSGNSQVRPKQKEVYSFSLSLLISVGTSILYVILLNVVIWDLFSKQLGPGGTAGLSSFFVTGFFAMFLCAVALFALSSMNHKRAWKIIGLYIAFSTIVMIGMTLAGVFYTTQGFG